jgi:hypothetical protein
MRESSSTGIPQAYKRPANTISDVIRASRDVQMSHKRMDVSTKKSRNPERPAAKLTYINLDALPSSKKKRHSTPSPFRTSTTPITYGMSAWTPTTIREGLTSMSFTCPDELQPNAPNKTNSQWSSDSCPSSICTRTSTPPSYLSKVPTASHDIEPDQNVVHATRLSHIRRSTTQKPGEINAERLGITFTYTDTLRATEKLVTDFVREPTP